MKALIFDEKVVDFSEDVFEVAPSMKWVSIPAKTKVKIGQGYAAGKFLAIQSDPEPTTDDLRRSAYAAESDPLFFKYQVALANGDPDSDDLKQAWLDSRDNIAIRYPSE